MGRYKILTTSECFHKLLKSSKLQRQMRVSVMYALLAKNDSQLITYRDKTYLIEASFDYFESEINRKVYELIQPDFLNLAIYIDEGVMHPALTDFFGFTRHASSDDVLKSLFGSDLRCVLPDLNDESVLRTIGFSDQWILENWLGIEPKKESV